MRLLVAHTVELAGVIAGWVYLGELIRGSDSATVARYISGYTTALLPLQLFCRPRHQMNPKLSV